ncbi:hypothetical protein like AT3G11600 [Hibiscus trionum]|uniref:GIR1-like zinc ribbon domain-containing protein n=1 Tax=Hibiscus trionum TaxID=183268 RepID=A0A9W7LXM9_HIBTR|nr:hypothetical protein like AT3G11600 [Hibiscus trionum]
MSRKANSPKVELKLKLSPPPTPGASNQQVIVSPNTSVSSSSEMSPESSCVSSEPPMRNPNNPEGTSMMVVGCPRCLMYVMLSQVNPKCPKCKSTVLLEFDNQGNAKN